MPALVATLSSVKVLKVSQMQHLTISSTVQLLER